MSAFSTIFTTAALLAVVTAATRVVIFLIVLRGTKGVERAEILVALSTCLRWWRVRE